MNNLEDSSSFELELINNHAEYFDFDARLLKAIDEQAIENDLFRQSFLDVLLTIEKQEKQIKQIRRNSHIFFVSYSAISALIVVCLLITSSILSTHTRIIEKIVNDIEQIVIYQERKK